MQSRVLRLHSGQQQHSILLLLKRFHINRSVTVRQTEKESEQACIGSNFYMSSLLIHLHTPHAHTWVKLGMNVCVCRCIKKDDTFIKYTFTVTAVNLFVRVRNVLMQIPYMVIFEAVVSNCVVIWGCIITKVSLMPHLHFLASSDPIPALQIHLLCLKISLRHSIPSKTLCKAIAFVIIAAVCLPLSWKLWKSCLQVVSSSIRVT